MGHEITLCLLQWETLKKSHDKGCGYFILLQGESKESRAEIQSPTGPMMAVWRHKWVTMETSWMRRVKLNSAESPESRGMFFCYCHLDHSPWFAPPTPRLKFEPFFGFYLQAKFESRETQIIGPWTIYLWPEGRLELWARRACRLWL